MKKKFSMILAGRELTVEVGQIARMANGSALVRYGNTVVLSTATAASETKEGIDFFPLSVDFEERLYAVGKIPGGFIKREGKPSEKAILTARVIDRSIRPLFPKDLRNEVSVVNLVMAVEQDNSPEIAAMIGSSIALSISNIPFNGPVGGVVLALIDNEVVINPTQAEREKSDMYVTLAGTKEKIVMIEAGAKEVDDDVMLDAIKKGHVEIKRIVEFIQNIVDEVGEEKFQYESSEVDEEIFECVKDIALEKMKSMILTRDKQERDRNISVITKEVKEALSDKFEDRELEIDGALYKLEKKIVRDYLFKEKKRVDGRGLEEIRPLSAEVDILPMVHGSALFQRGQTQVLTVATLGAMSEIQVLDGLDLNKTDKRYMHHYNFPGYSVGEAKSSRGPGRREIGHGALAERALEAVIPSKDEFPYTIRLVSEVTMSNGSTSQGSVCGSTLALMAAGVPIKAPVAGISAGLIVNEEDDSDFLTFMDIQGIEDFFGDMDFKVAGTKKGITAIQVDMKVNGLSYDIIEQAFRLTKKGRYQIIDDVILKTIDKPRSTVSMYAPKIFTSSVNPEKIKDIIGPGGKTINKIIEDTGVKIDIEEDGKVFVSSVDISEAKRAMKIIEGIAKDVEVGQIYLGIVKKIATFGVFVEILPGKEGLVHISKLDKNRVSKAEDLFKVGDEILVKVIDIDKQGRISLSRKDAMKSEQDENIERMKRDMDIGR